MDLLALCDGEISVLRRDKAANLKKESKEKKEVSAKDSNSGEHPEFSSPLSFMEAGIHPFSLLLLYCCLQLWDLLLIQSQLWILFAQKTQRFSGSGQMVLVQEAAGLLAKESIVPVSHVKGAVCLIIFCCL